MMVGGKDLTYGPYKNGWQASSASVGLSVSHLSGSNLSGSEKLSHDIPAAKGLVETVTCHKTRSAHYDSNAVRITHELTPPGMK